MDFEKMLQMVPFLSDEDLLMQIKLFELGHGPITCKTVLTKKIFFIFLKNK
jgi:hypothetical protein